MKLPIPNHPGFTACDEGHIYKHSNKLTAYEDKNGYLRVLVTDSKGKSSTKGIHRLVAMAFHKHRDKNRTYVNHKTKDKKDNRPCNVEWVTAEENNIHDSVTMLNPKRPRVIVEYEDNAWLEDNIYTAQKSTGVDALQIWECIKDDVKYGQYKFRHQRVKSPLPDEFRKPTGMIKGHNGLTARSIKLLCVKTGKVLRFSSFKEAASYFKTNPSHVIQGISSDGSRSFKRQYLVAYEEDSFPEITDSRKKAILAGDAFEVLAYNEDENLFYIYSSASQFYSKNGLSRKAVSTRLKKGKIGPVGCWYFTYTSNKENVAEIRNMLKQQSPVC
jgi:hypothetical protein|tara:strand:- start:93 stop:1079 length:987 start_codon:yes stop_codon:yes gene_type:complete